MIFYCKICGVLHSVATQPFAQRPNCQKGAFGIDRLVAASEDVAIGRCFDGQCQWRVLLCENGEAAEGHWDVQPKKFSVLQREKHMSPQKHQNRR